MRITKGNYKRRFVYNVKLGDTQVKRLMLAGNQIWPSGERIRTIAIEPPTDPYWVHAFDALQSGASASKYISLVIAGRRYLVNATYDFYPLAQYSLGILDFGADGPPYDAVKVGDSLSLSIRISARDGRVLAEGDSLEPLPFLTGTKLRVQWAKGKKEKAAGCVFNVRGMPSGTIHFGGWCDTSEHKRRKKTRVLPDNTHKWRNPVYNGIAVEGDDSLAVTVSTNGSGYAGSVTPLWPAFSDKLEVKVTAVTLYE